MARYTFGTDDPGARRLETIARFFNPLAARVIQQHLDDQPRQSAVDLGCGPGFSTDMLAKASGCSKTYGLDSAIHFIKLAEARFPNYTFILHDLTQIPFPVQADVMYVRFVLSHLQHVVQTVNRWLTALKPGGMLFIDETETVESEVEVFQHYLAMNAGMIASQGACLWIGKTLAEGEYEAEVVSSTCEPIPVANFQAATWFLPNVETVWRTDPYVQARLSPQDRQYISAEITRIMESGDSREQSVWNMRRLVLRSKA